MPYRKQTYRYLMLQRNIWLLTFISIVIVFFGWLLILSSSFKYISFHNLIEQHKAFPAAFLFDALPIILFALLQVARIQTLNEIKKSEERSRELGQLLDQNSDFAIALAEGDDPELFPEMLGTEIGKALKLIHLNMRSNRRKEREVTWITEGKDMISRVLRMHSDMDELSAQVLQYLTKYIHAIQGAVYLHDEELGRLINVSQIAYNRRKFINQSFKIGEGLVGQCAYEMDFVHRTEIPDDYITITSGIIGDQKPKSILLIPLITNQKIQGVIEFAFLEQRIPKITIQFLLELGEIIAQTLFNLKINEQTRLLLAESQKMTEELKDNEKVLQQNAKEMALTQEQLTKANLELQNKVEEVEIGQDRLYKFLENASEIISIYDENFRLKYISPSVEHILGYSAKEMMHGKDFERIDQNGAKEIRKAFDKLKDQPGTSKNITYVFITKDGQHLHLSTNIKNQMEDPSVNGYIFNTRDITESIQIEKEQRLKSRMQSLSENSLDLIIRISSNGIIHYANPIIEDYANINPGALLNQPLNEVPMNKRLREIFSTSIHKMRVKPIKFELEETIPVALGEKISERILSINAIPELQEDELETVLFVGHDITEAKRIEAEIKVTNRKIQDSINYAERIQSSILPSVEHIRKSFPRSFIYYTPKDVISGDFPWYKETKDASYIAAIDCTGHGVPGALLSFVGFFLLNNLSSIHPELAAGELADMLHQEVRKTLKQDQDHPETRDGMDMGLCKIDKKAQKIEYVGAHRPLYLLRENELMVFKGDRKAIGGLLNPRKPDLNFTNHEIEYRKGDKIFIFSDGLSDQLGADGMSKYSPSRIREILVDHPGFTIEQFHEYFMNDFKKWLGIEKQLDDVLMIGIEL